MRTELVVSVLVILLALLSLSLLLGGEECIAGRRTVEILCGREGPAVQIMNNDIAERRTGVV